MAADGQGGPTLWEFLTGSAWVPGLALIGGGVYRVWTAFWSRLDQQRAENKKDKLTAKEQLETEFSNRILYANTATKELIERQTAMLADADERLETIERKLTAEQVECGRGWDTARYWYDMHRTYGHEISNLQTTCLNLARRLTALGQLTQDQQPMFLVTLPKETPSLEAPFPRQPTGKPA